MDEVKNQLVKDVAALVNRVTQLEQQVLAHLTPPTPPTPPTPEPKRKMFQRRPKTEAPSEALPDEPAEEPAPSEQPQQQG